MRDWLFVPLILGILAGGMALGLAPAYVFARWAMTQELLGRPWWLAIVAASMACGIGWSVGTFMGAIRAPTTVAQFQSGSTASLYAKP